MITVAVYCLLIARVADTIRSHAHYPTRMRKVIYMQGGLCSILQFTRIYGFNYPCTAVYRSSSLFSLLVQDDITTQEVVHLPPVILVVS